MRPTYHLAPADDWSVRDANAPYTAPSLAAEGFIHCTDGADAMVATANRHYRDDPRAFLVLTVDLDATGSPWRSEDPERIYPHVFGPIAPTAIIDVAPILRAPGGTFLPFGSDDPVISSSEGVEPT